MDINIKLDYTLVLGFTLLFFILKITHYINWSWIWVFSPIWISVIISLLFIFIYFKIIKRKRR